MENYIVLNGKRAELTPEQIKALGIECPHHSVFDRAEKHIPFYYISDTGKLNSWHEANNELCGKMHAVANYCTDKAIMEQRALHETLNRLLWRYSMEHDGDKIDWGNGKAKWHIFKEGARFKALWGAYTPDILTVYFYTETICKDAIKEIVIPFMKAHPDFRI